jgi:hypothetical protein
MSPNPNSSSSRRTSRVSSAAAVFSATLAALLGSCAGETADVPDFDPALGDYIRSIPPLPPPAEYDLEHPAPPPTNPLPGIICDWTYRDVVIGPYVFPALSAQADVIYPGADVQAATLSDGIPTPITAPRAGGTIALTNNNGVANVRELSHIGLGDVTNAINSIISNQPTGFPADLQVSITKVRSREELQLALQASASFFDLFSLDAGFQVYANEIYSSFLVTLDQNFYTIAFERPERIEELYAAGVSPSDLQAQAYDGNPPGYVSQVTYGRVFYLLVQSTSSAEEIEATLSANFLDVASGSGQFQFLSEFDSITIDAYAYGGDQQEVLGAIAGGLGSLSGFIANLASGSQVEDAKPKSYTVRSIADDSIIRMGISADYYYTNCHEAGNCTPLLQSPSSGATLDNGCTVDPNPISWSFNWSNCPDATKYQIHVKNTDLGVLIDEVVTNSSYSTSQLTGALPETGWTWKVRAYSFGEWDSWTTTRQFKLQPANSDCLTGVRFYTHPSHGGGSIFFDADQSNLENVSGWDDQIDSLKLYNIQGVKLYMDPNYSGGSYTFQHDCPDVEFHGSHAGMFQRNGASSFKILP